MSNYSFYKLVETGSYYYYMYVAPKPYPVCDNYGWYIMRTDSSGNNAKYVYGINNADTAWTNRESYLYKLKSEWSV